MAHLCVQIVMNHVVDGKNYTLQSMVPGTVAKTKQGSVKVRVGGAGVCALGRISGWWVGEWVGPSTAVC